MARLHRPDVAEQGQLADPGEPTTTTQGSPKGSATTKTPLGQCLCRQDCGESQDEQPSITDKCATTPGSARMKGAAGRTDSSDTDLSRPLPSTGRPLSTRPSSTPILEAHGQRLVATALDRTISRHATTGTSHRTQRPDPSLHHRLEPAARRRLIACPSLWRPPV
jgi:hypothetical protein